MSVFLFHLDNLARHVPASVSSLHSRGGARKEASKQPVSLRNGDPYGRDTLGASGAAKTAAARATRAAPGDFGQDLGIFEIEW
jgi:hypothetical protein